MKRLKLLLLANNLVCRPGLLAEHGLAFWLEDGERRVLFDTGQGLALCHNAAALGVDLGRVTDVVLSHGHYDHTGGLAQVAAAIRGGAPRLWMLPAATTAPRFSRHQDGSMHDIGMPAPCRDALVRFASPTDRPAAGPNEIMPGIFTTGPIPREHAWETSADFFLDAAGHEVDEIPDDQAMWLDTAAGVVVLLGCAHAGCINTLELIRRQAGGRPSAPAMLVPLHCTGAAAGVLRHEFPATCRAWGVGDGTTFDM